MELISTVTVGAGGAASIDFNSIPQTFTDLVLVMSARGVYAQNTGYGAFAKFNGSATGYSWRELDGMNYSGTNVVLSYNSSAQAVVPIGYVTAANQTANTFGNSAAYIPNYAGSTNKSVSLEGVDENNSQYFSMIIAAGLWANTAAITSISISTNGAGNFAQYSSATLYGITKGSGGATVS